MGKPITSEQIEAFRNEIRDFLGGEDTAYVTIESIDLLCEEDDDGAPAWEFHAANYNPDESHDIFELLGAVSDEFEFEEEGYGSWFVTKLA